MVEHTNLKKWSTIIHKMNSIIRLNLRSKIINENSTSVEKIWIKMSYIYIKLFIQKKHLLVNVFENSSPSKVELIMLLV